MRTKVVVPDLRGLLYPEAAFRLLALGLDTEITRIPPIRPCTGVVVSHDPAPGTRVRESDTITLSLVFP
jgi:beta-lactam-binding protein with PASTA domain